MAENLFLVGPMGAGKSAIGRQLARRLKRPFRDSDKEIERRTGVDIRTIFEYEGEPGFRARESAMLDELTRESGIVLATGGGAVVLAQNREWLKNRGATIYLRTSVETQFGRTARDRRRPLLHTENPRARLEELFKERDPLYREVAKYAFETDHQKAASIVGAIIRTLRERGEM